MSRYEYLLPDLGEGIAEAEVVAWLVEPGEIVKEHQALLEVATDKAQVELPSPVTGVLLAQGAVVGGMIKVGEQLAVLDLDETTSIPANPEESTTAAPRPLASPAVRQHARDQNVDLAGLPGSGPGGRILREDVDRAAQTIESPPMSEAVVASQDTTTRIPLRGLRRAIARRMTETLRTVPHVSGMQEIDVTGLGELLGEMKPFAEAEGVRLTWTPFFALATIQALQEFPQLNASLDDEKEEIVLHHQIHLGIATATPDGLLVPVVRDAGNRSLLDLAAEIARVGDLARTRAASVAELTGSTFTLTNYGAVGGWFATPMVNAPEIGIVGFGRVADRPAVFNGELGIRATVALSVSVDHRLIDGAVGAAFSGAIRRRLEQPQLLLLGACRGHG